MDAVTEGTQKHLLAAAEVRLRDLCAISSESGNADGIRRIAAYISAELRRHGLRVQIVDEPDAAGVNQPVLIARGPSTGDRHLLLLGHMDTVLPAIEPEVEQRRLFATGALDMKGGLAMLLGALDLLEARGETYPDDVLIVLVPDEESESFISGAATTKWSRDARTVLVLEPGQVCEKGETLVAGRRGLTEWTIEFTGRAAHSGLAFWEGRSALAAAADWATRATNLAQRGAGPTVNVARIVGGGTDFVQNLAKHHDMIGTSRQRNVISDKAVAEGEIRFLTAGDGVAVMEELARIATRVAAEHGVTVDFKPGITVSPVDPHGPGAPLISRAVELAAARGFHLEVEDDRGGISFPNFIADPATTPVLDGLGPTGDGMHVRGEYLNLDSLQRRIVLLADLLATL
jgi:glutamate carboxypeptidase